MGSIGPGLGSRDEVCRGRGRFIGVGRRGEPRVGEGAGGGEGPCLHGCPRPAPLACVRYGGLGGGDGDLLWGSRGPKRDDLGARVLRGEIEGVTWRSRGERGSFSDVGFLQPSGSGEQPRCECVALRFQRIVLAFCPVNLKP